MSKTNIIIKKWKEGTKQKDIANSLEVSEAYISQILAPEKRNNQDEYNELFEFEYIYFIKVLNYVKIGYTKNLNERLNNIQISNPYPLELLFVIKNDRNLESSIHKFYKKYNKHYRGEWFIYDDFTTRVIKLLKIYNKQINKMDKIKNKIIKGFIGV